MSPAYTKAIATYLPNASACPNRVGVAELGRTFFEEAFEFGELFVVELRRSTRPRFGREGFDTVFFDKSPPKSDGRKAAAENCNDFIVVVTLFDQFPALNPAVL